MARSTLLPGSYALASDLVGFGPLPVRLRVKVVQQVSERDVVVVTADLRDAGTTLNLDVAQVAAEAA